MEDTNPNVDFENKTPVPPPLKIQDGLHKDYNRNSSYAVGGVIIIVAGIIILFILPMGNVGIFITLGVLMIIMAFQTPLKFREDHFIFKGAPLATSHKVYYSTINSIDYEKKKITIHSSGKPIVITKGLFHTDDWEEIINTFKSIKH